MTYTIRRSRRAQQEIRDFFRYLRREAGETIAENYRAALQHDILTIIAGQPRTFSYFHETGAPFHAKLFKLARTTYWIIYTVDDEEQTADLVAFWNSARKQGTHGLMGQNNPKV